jgi:hypothetical protein
LSEQSVPKRGRPPKPEGKTLDARVQLLCKSAEKERWQEAASVEDRSLNDVVRKLLNEWSECVLKRNRRKT